MAVLVELLGTRQNAIDYANRQTASREWYAEGILPDAVMTVENWNDVYAWNGPGNVIFDSVRIEPHPDGKSTRVVSLFSNSKQFRFPAKVDDTDPFFSSTTVSFDRVRHEIPQAQYEAEAVKVTDKDGAVKTKAAWVPGSRQVPAAHMFIERRVALQSFTPDDAAVIQSQMDHVHQIPANFPLWGRFSAGEITETEPGKWTTTYYWDCDPGNLIVLGCIPYPGKEHTCIFGLEPADLVGPLGIPGAIAVPNAFYGQIPTDKIPIYARPPFSETIMIMDSSEDSDGNPKAPSFDYLFDGVLDPTGWTVLPGEPF